MATTLNGTMIVIITSFYAYELEIKSITQCIDKLDDIY
jgi:hypothetical protein